jgi:hypothetical protein
VTVRGGVNWFAVRVGSLVVVTVALSACLDVPAPTAAPTAIPTPEPTPVTTSYPMGTTVWYEGLVIKVNTATSTLDERGGPVNVQLVLQNDNEDDSDLSARVLFDPDGEGPARPVAMTRDSKIPTVPAHGSASTILTYELQGVASVDRAEVVIGEAPNHVALVPLTGAAGSTVALKPVNLTVSGTAHAGSLGLALRGGVIRWDLPDWSQELAGDLEVITLTYDVTYDSGFTGGFAFTGDNVQLRLPDGTILDARKDGHSQSVELIAAHQTKRALFSRFEIPNGTKGKLTLLLHNGAASDTIRFTVPA